MGDPRVVGREARVAQQDSEPEAREEGGRRGGRRRRQRDPFAVTRLVGPARARVVGLVAVAGSYRSVQRVLGGGRAEDGKQRLVERDVDHLTASRDVIAVTQSGQDGGRARERGDHVGHRERGERRRPVGRARRRRKAAHRLDHGAEAGPVAIRAVLAPAGYAGEDESGIVLGQDPPAEPPLLESAGQEVLDEDVGASAQTP